MRAPGGRNGSRAHKLSLRLEELAGICALGVSVDARAHATQTAAPAVQGSASAGQRLPIAAWVTDGGMRVACYDIPVTEVPADFFADPDGSWTYDSLVQAAGFAAYKAVAIGALKEPFNGHIEGTAIVTLNSEARPYIAIVECPIAYECTASSARTETSAA